MIKTVNDIIRSNIFDNSIQDMTNYIMKLDRKSYNSIIKLLLNDYYKMKMFYSILEDDNSFLEKLKGIDINDLVNRFNVDISFKQEVTFFAKKFHLLSNLSKAHLMDIINKEECDKFLYNISENYILDKFYTVIYDLEYLKQDYLEHIKKEPLMKGEDISLLIARKLIEHSKINRINYEKIVLELIKKYYIRLTFLMENFNDELVLREENYVYIDLIKSESLDNIIKLTTRDSDFLSDLVFDYLENSTEEFIVSDDDLEEYFVANADEEIKKKLKIFDD